ncbi:hypothetical protein A244_25074 [Pseudomonas syringae pv. actinidiae ICMP 18807]|uniref:Uncharacterized protein n=1 Tax=Pseudomonas syringae pv. actinidiae ICMP 18807 TaxID=1194404 RepID=S6TRA5_PSESF|nr:hypothetical protein [Pseudomonas syringae]EPN45748.1 hypothetical protein A244_25074 [Pseudomonas syringae pv. actinidiae ICMP 18807]
MDVLEPLERMLLRREIAISLSELGGWAAAAEQFAHARADVLLTRHDDGQALSLGLLADQALALYQTQDFFSAVTLYEAVLEALPLIDAIETLQAEYCSRVSSNISPRSRTALTCAHALDKAGVENLAMIQSETV